MPTYRVDRVGSDLPRVVVASLPSSALKHVVSDEITVRQIEVDEAFELAQQGVQLERAGESAAERGLAEPPMTNGGNPGLTPGVDGDEGQAGIDGVDAVEPSDEEESDEGSEFDEGEDQQQGEPQFYGESAQS